MNHTLIVHKPYGVADVGQDRRGLVLAQSTSLHDVVEEFATRQQFSHEVELVFIYYSVLEAHDVRVPASF